MILKGSSLLLASNSMVEPWLKSGELVQVLAQYDYLNFDIFMFYRAYEYELPKIKSFISFFSKFLNKASISGNSSLDLTQ